MLQLQMLWYWNHWWCQRRMVVGGGGYECRLIWWNVGLVESEKKMMIY